MKRFTYELKRMAWLMLMLICVQGTTVAQNIGDTFIAGKLQYSILNEHEVKVNSHVDSSYATGEVIIPETVEAAEWNKNYTVKRIGEEAFKGCNRLTTIKVPNSVTTIGYAAFQDCDGLTSINIPESVTAIENYVFSGCNGLTSINIPNAVTTIGDYAFSGCNGLTTINIPNSVTTIGEFAFFNCWGMTEIHIPSSVTTIGNQAFAWCYLNAITVNADNAYFSSYEGVLFDKSQQKLILCPEGKKGEYNIPNSVTTIGYCAFLGCSELAAINIPNSVTTIGSHAFSSCRGLAAINIPNSVTTIGYCAFLGCSELAAITVNTDNDYFSSYEGVLFDKSQHTIIRCPEGKKGEYKIPNSVITIENSAFQDCSGLTTINIPNSVTKIGNSAFESCNELTTINIPNSVTTIGNSAFQFCDGLATLYIQSILPPTASEGCFLGCYNLQTIYVPQEAVSTYQATAPYNEHNIQGIAPIRSELGDEVRTWDTLYCQKMPATEWTNHGVLKSAAQLKTNKLETNEGAIANLLDGDTQTFFQSTWSVPNTNMEAHYLQIDLGGELQHLLVKYAESNNPNNSEPRKVKVYATKDTLNGWTDLGTARFLNRTGTLRMDLGAPYRYLKLEIVETFSNMENNGNRFFTWSELGIWNGAALRPETCQQVPALLAQIVEAEALGQEPSDELTTQATALKAQLIKGDTCRFYDQAFHAVRTQAEANVARAEYVRNYEHTNWQALYLPFDIAFDDISDRFDVARLNNIHQYDDNEDGQFDRTELEVLHLKAGGTLKANIPYMVRAKQTGEQTMAATNVTVQPMTSKQLDCSSITHRYLFTGSYQEISGQDMFTKKYYAMSQGNLSLATNPTAYLSPFRWYMVAEDRTGNSAAYTPKMIRVVDIETGETTGIGEVETTEAPQSGNIYDLNGRLVRTDGNLQALPKGIYILNGKKVVR